jgi:prepilin peptidase CpaA
MVVKVLSLLPMVALLVWAAVQDVRTRRIRNWLTLSLAGSGLLASLVPHGGVGPSQALLGLLVGFAVPFVLFALGALGGGDVKLLAGIGAWMGPADVFAVFVVAAIVGLVIVLIQCTAQGKLFALFRNSAVLTMNLMHVGELGARHVAETGQACRSIDRPLPYAVPVLVATVLVAMRPML